MLFPIKVGRQVVPLSGDYYVNDDGFRSSLVVAGQLPVADIAPADSVAVLGEPGIGKSHAICELTSGDARVVDLELDTLTDASELRERLAAVDAAIREGVAPDRITVVLDSLDECGLPRKALLRQLEASVRRHPHLRGHADGNGPRRPRCRRQCCRGSCHRPRRSAPLGVGAAK